MSGIDVAEIQRPDRAHLGDVFTGSRPVKMLWQDFGRRAYSHATDVGTSLPHWRDRRLAMSEEPPAGGHLVSPRIGFVHHGIYLGDGKVIHCGAVSRFLPRWRKFLCGNSAAGDR